MYHSRAVPGQNVRQNTAQEERREGNEETRHVSESDSGKPKEYHMIEAQAQVFPVAGWLRTSDRADGMAQVDVQMLEHGPWTDFRVARLRTPVSRISGDFTK